MAIAYRSSTTAGSGDNGNVTINRPSGVANDDILVAVLYREGGTWTLPSGWTQLAEVRDIDNVLYVTAVWKRAASEPASYTFQIASGPWRTIAMSAFSGAETSGSPVDVYATDNANDAVDYSIDAASITTTVANTMNIVLMANVQGDNITAGSSGYTEAAGLGGVEVWYASQASAGASGIKTFSSTNFTARWATIHLALKEPSSGGAALTVADTSHSHTVDAITLAQHHALTVADTSQAHSVDSLALAQHHALTVADTAQAHSTDSLVLAQKHTLTVHDTLHAHSVESAPFVSGLEIAGANHAHTVEALALAQHHALAIQDATHGHTVDSPGFVFNLEIDDSAHAHSAEVPTFTQRHYLVIQDTIHGHTAESPGGSAGAARRRRGRLTPI